MAHNRSNLDKVPISELEDMHRGDLSTTKHVSWMHWEDQMLCLEETSGMCILTSYHMYLSHYWGSAGRPLEKSKSYLHFAHFNLSNLPFIEFWGTEEALLLKAMTACKETKNRMKHICALPLFYAYLLNFRLDILLYIGMLIIKECLLKPLPRMKAQR